jgi:indolepyruvate ferredoxin oxidoreductase beta subunit
MQPHAAFINPSALNFLLVGVGGQGTILASNVLAEVGMNLGFDVKQAEVHGMSQRGGSVTSQVRWAEQVFSPMISRGEADVLLAFEMSEAVRFIHHVKSSGVVLVNNHAIVPVTVTSGASSYPTQEDINQTLSGYTKHLTWLDGVSIAREAGNAKASNVVMLGALSTCFSYPAEIWRETLEKRVPARLLEINLKAFESGRAAMARQD